MSNIKRSKERQEECIKLWTKLSENPGKDKEDIAPFAGNAITTYDNNCPACAEAWDRRNEILGLDPKNPELGRTVPAICEFCPITSWADSNGEYTKKYCVDRGGMTAYDAWGRSTLDLQYMHVEPVITGHDNERARSRPTREQIEAKEKEVIRLADLVRQNAVDKWEHDYD